MEKIKNLIDNYQGELYNLCYEIISTAEDLPKVFEFVCTYYSSPPENGTIPINEYITKDEIAEYKSILGDIVDGLLNSTIKKCNLGILNPEVFYATLWNNYCTIFSSTKEQAFAFYYTIIDTSIPYLYLGKPLSMENEKYKELIDKNTVHIDKIKYIAKCNYNQHTERASLLLNCLNEVEDFESKTVVLAQAIKIFNTRTSRSSSLDIDRLLQHLDRRIEELEQQEVLA